MRNSSMPISLAQAQVTLSGVLHAQPAGVEHLPLASALQLSLDVVRLVAKAHDEGRVIGVLDAAHLICRANGALGFGGAAGGNPIAPELKRGEGPDRLSDVYALGAVLYRLLTGRKVVPARIIEPPSHFNPAVDSPLDELVLQALDEDPSERPYSARELEQRLLEIFAELGLEPSSRSEATQVIASSLVARKPELPRLAPDDDDEEELAAPRGRFGQFLYDLGWVRAAPRRPSVALGDEPPSATAEHLRPRSRLSQFMYDLGWLQGIDWDSPQTVLYLKRGGIALAVLLLIIVAWPGKKQPRLTAAQAALIAQTEKSERANVEPSPKASPKVLTTTVRAKSRR